MTGEITIDEVNDYLKEKGIDSFVYKLIKYQAVVFYGNDEEIGIKHVFKDENDIINCASGRSILNSSNNPIDFQLSSWGDVGKDEVAVIGIRINDKILIDDGCEMIVKFTNGIIRRGYIDRQKLKIVEIGDMDVFDLHLQEITIINSLGDEIFNKEYIKRK